jgi:8-oxoguanine deaminase
MNTLLLRNAPLLVSMDDHKREWPGGAIYVEDNVIRQIGPTAQLPEAPAP